jgi:S1-C subfamily serine protease
MLSVGLEAVSAGPRLFRVPDSRHSVKLGPELFAELSSGIGLIRSFDCRGAPLEEGTGFLVGSRVAMTAWHVIRTACRVKVLLDGSWIPASGWGPWSTRGRNDAAAADVATIRLSSVTTGHVFAIRSSSAAVGSKIAALGRPLGENISLTQGTVILKGKYNGIPMLAMRDAFGAGSTATDAVCGRPNELGRGAESGPASQSARLKRFQIEHSCSRA